MPNCMVLHSGGLDDDSLIIFYLYCLPVLFSVRHVPCIDIAILLIMYTEAKTEWIPTPRTSKEVA